MRQLDLGVEHQHAGRGMERIDLVRVAAQQHDVAGVHQRLFRVGHPLAARAVDADDGEPVLIGEAARARRGPCDVGVARDQRLRDGLVRQPGDLVALAWIEPGAERSRVLAQVFGGLPHQQPVPCA
jgi:hypothetical protein